MRGGFRQLVHPATVASAMDVEASRQRRQELHEQVRLRAHLLCLLSEAPVDEELVRVSKIEAVADLGHGEDEDGGEDAGHGRGVWR